MTARAAPSSFPRGTNFAPGGITSTTKTSRGKAKFTFNNKFFDEWGRDPQVVARFEELRSIMEAEAQTRVPVDSGGLLRSIRSRVVRSAGRDQLRVELTAGGPGIGYWLFVEYGTGQRGRSSRQPEPGVPAGFKHGLIPGQRAQPFLRPSILAVKRKVSRGRPR